jgi:hypothetical protein
VAVLFTFRNIRQPMLHLHSGRGHVNIIGRDMPEL